MQLEILGDLVVEGTTTTIDSQTVLIADSYLDLNVGHTVATAETGGLAVNFLPTATVKRRRAFCRRRRRTSRPPRVFMRARKPCFRSLLTRLGW